MLAFDYMGDEKQVILRKCLQVVTLGKSFCMSREKLLGRVDFVKIILSSIEISLFL